MNKWVTTLVVMGTLIMAIKAGQAAEYFVDAVAGNDANSGLTPAQAWRSVEQVNGAPLKPGDTVRFRAGQTWRESLLCKSGTEGHPVTYTRFGEGSKPAILASVDLSSPDCWVSDGGNIWKTWEDKIVGAQPLPTFASGNWTLHYDGNALATLKNATNDQSEKVYTLTCQKKGDRSTNIQLNCIGFDLKPGQVIRYRFRAKATKPFEIKNISLMCAQKPWGKYGNVLTRSADIGTEWQEHEILLRTTIHEPVTNGRLSFFIGDVLPDGAVFSFIPLGAELVEYQTLGLTADVGNIILVAKGQSEKTAGWKRWDLASLTKQGDFFHDPADNRLYFYSEGNPANTYSQIEAALKQCIVQFRNSNHVVVDGLTIAYTGAHGATGNSCKHGTIRNCDFLWIGGSHLYTRDNHPTRYGNGVEFWDSCEDMTVENNYFENIYDTAMTNQGTGKGLVRNMVWRNNKTFRCEQSYEIWFSSPDMQVDELYFTGNECIDAGYGWGHVQRPNKNGCHLLAYNLQCKIKDIHYEHNIFNNARDAQTWFFNPRLNEFTINHNAYIQKCPAPQEAKLFRWHGVPEKGVTFDAYRKAADNDHDSTLTN